MAKEKEVQAHVEEPRIMVVGSVPEKLLALVRGLLALIAETLLGKTEGHSCIPSPFAPEQHNSALAYQACTRLGLVQFWSVSSTGAPAVRFISSQAQDCICCGTHATAVVTVGASSYGLPYEPVSFVCSMHARELIEWAKRTNVRFDEQLTRVVADRIESITGRPVTSGEYATLARDFVRYSPVRYLTTSERKAEAVNFAL